MSIHDDIVSLCDPSVEFDYGAWGRVHDHLFRSHFWLLREYYTGAPSTGPAMFERGVRSFLSGTSNLTEVRACPECGENFAKSSQRTAVGSSAPNTNQAESLAEVPNSQEVATSAKK